MQIFAIAAVVLLLTFRPAAAETTVDEVVRLVADICLASKDGARQLALAKTILESSGWQRDTKRSGLQQGIIATPEDLKRPPMYDAAVYRRTSDKGAAEFQVSSVTPEWHGYKLNSCSIMIPGSDEAPLESVVRERFKLAEPAQIALGKAFVLEGQLGGRGPTRMIFINQSQLSSGPSITFGLLDVYISEDFKLPAAKP